MQLLEHSITFTTKANNLGIEDSRNTWESWNLVPTSKPMVAPPEYRLESMEQPIQNGSLDATEILDGKIHKGNCTGSWEFFMMNEMDTMPTFSDILRFLHGQWLTVQLYDDPSRTYEGLIKVDSTQSNNDYASLTISYSLSPVYKKG